MADAKSQRAVVPGGNGSAQVVCPTCGKTVVPDDGYCPNCGSPIGVAAAATPSAGAAHTTATNNGTITCPVCGTANPSGQEYCTSCGAPLEQVLAIGGTGSVAAPPAVAGPIKCVECGSMIPLGEEFCPTCGAPSSLSLAASATAGPAEQTNCPNCGAPLRPGAKFCRECGARFSTVAPTAPANASAGLSVGQVLAGRYKLVAVVGGGGMGTVFRGVDTHLTSRQEPEGRQVAVKAIINSADPELLAAAVEERDMLVRLDHPNIVRIYDIVTLDNIPYIVMGFVQGTSWKDMYDQNGGPLPEAEALRLLLAMRGAFEYLHGRTPPVVYRDFKPGNVIQVTEPGGATRQVLIDLGTAIEYFPGQAHQAWGTIGYAPPEIGGICEQAPTMDLYGIVSTLAALLGLDVAEMLAGVPEREAWPVSEEIYDLVERGRDIDPRARFATASELFDQLEGINRFIQGRQNVALTGARRQSGRSSSSLTAAMVPVQSRLITGRLGNTTGRIGALPAPSNTDPAQALLAPVRDLVDTAKYADALGQIDTVLRAYPGSIDAYLLQATALNNLGRGPEAHGALQQAERLSTPATRWRTLLVQAQAAQVRQDTDASETLYKELIKLVPGEVLPKQALADLYRQIGRYPDAAELYGRVVAADPANADAVLGLADSLVALDQTDRAISVLDAINENALRYVDAQIHLIELYLSRIGRFIDTRPDDLQARSVPRPDLQALLHDLDLAGRAIAALNDRTESRHFDRLRADWWYASYRLSRYDVLPADLSWPDNAKHATTPAAVGEATREAYRRYLERAPGAPDREDVLARIYFDIKEWQ